MKKIFTIIFLILLISCNNSKKQQPDNTIPNQKTKAVIDTLKKVDTTHNQNTKAVIQTQTKEKIEDIDSIKRFLLNPFNLFEFKKKVDEYNSGGATKKSCYYKPDKKGMYYSLFGLSDGKGYWYLNKTRKIETIQFMGLEITTYKPYGKYKEEFLDPTEELIEVKAKLNNYDLPELAFIGLNITEIKHQLGKESFIKENCMVYTYKDRALILGLNENKVKWLRYIHLNTVLTIDKKIKDIYEE